MTEDAMTTHTADLERLIKKMEERARKEGGIQILCRDTDEYTDVTSEILAMEPSEIHDMEDADWEWWPFKNISPRTYERAREERNLLIKVKASICAFFRVKRITDVTEHHLEAARAAYGDGKALTARANRRLAVLSYLENAEENLRAAFDNPTLEEVTLLEACVLRWVEELARFHREQGSTSHHRASLLAHLNGALNLE